MAVSSSSPGFIFSADGKSAPSYDQLQKRRRVFDALMERQASQRAPQTIGEGLNALGQGIVAGIEGRALRKEEEALGERQKELWSKLSALGEAPGVSPPNFGAGAGYGSATGAISDASATPSGTIDAASALPASFLASVDRVEGGGDYDTLFGHSQKSGPFAGVRVSDMTIGQALDFSDPGGSYGRYVKGKVGRIATPMGRHQIVGTTLRNAAAEMGLDLSTPFNQQTQDSIAAHLARKRVASADTMGGKIMALRSEWEGFKHVPDAELATIVMDLQNGGGAAPSQPAEPVQVASLDPSAGIAQATAPNARANASVSTMPSTPSDVPVPTPAATAREALERAAATQAQRAGQTSAQPYTGPAENDPGAMSSIAPVGMPGASAQTDAAIQQYHAANGSTPMQYQGGKPEPGMVTAPGSIADQQADAQLAGDPDRPIIVPTPTPRPDMGQPAGIPPQAIAASAMAQQPAPYDPVNGTAMGGNTGAADAAKAAYLEANGRSPAVQRVAEAMNRSSATAAPAPSASPAVQRVAEAKMQVDAQGRFGQLMQIMMDPSASPEQKQVASMYLDRDQQLQTQQQARQWEMWKLQETRAYDERKAERDRIAGNADYMTRKRIDQQFERPQIIEVFDPETGRQRKGYMGQDGRFVPVGGVEASKGYRDLTPEEVAQRGLPLGAYQAGPDGKIEGVGKGGITINTGDNGSKFIEKSDEAAAKRLDDIVVGGQSAAQTLGDVQQLADLGRQIGTGLGAQVMAKLGPYAEAVGINVEGLAPAQAYQSIIARMAPQMRPAGSGATSDFDARQFLQSLPSLGNTPDGNQIITDTFAAVQQNKMQAAEIASLAYVPKEQGGITWQEAERQIRALPNPYERFRAMRRQLPQPEAASAPAQAQAPAPMPAQPTPQQQAPAQPAAARQRWDRGAPVAQPAAPVPQRATNPQTGQVIELRNGQWVPVQ